MYGVGSEGGTKKKFVLNPCGSKFWLFVCLFVVVVAAVVVDVVVECG